MPTRRDLLTAAAGLTAAALAPASAAAAPDAKAARQKLLDERVAHYARIVKGLEAAGADVSAIEIALAKLPLLKATVAAADPANRRAALEALVKHARAAEAAKARGAADASPQNPQSQFLEARIEAELLLLDLPA